MRIVEIANPQNALDVSLTIDEVVDQKHILTVDDYTKLINIIQKEIDEKYPIHIKQKLIQTKSKLTKYAHKHGIADATSDDLVDILKHGDR